MPFGARWKAIFQCAGNIFKNVFSACVKAMQVQRNAIPVPVIAACVRFVAQLKSSSNTVFYILKGSSYAASKSHIVAHSSFPSRKMVD